MPRVPALGRGPAPTGEPAHADHHHPAAGWGAATSVSRVVARSGRPVAAARALLKMNHGDGGFDCPGCAWPDDLDGLHMDFCENGVKHLTWELTGKRVDRRFLERQTVAELSQWNDSALEEIGRLTEPMAYDPTSDRYLPMRATLPDSLVPWEAYLDDYDRIRETMSQVLPGFADFNRRARRPHGFRIPQPARERVFHTPSRRMEFSLAGLPVDTGRRRVGARDGTLPRPVEHGDLLQR